MAKAEDMKLRKVLEYLGPRLRGRLVTEDEAAILRKQLPSDVTPDWLLDLLRSYRLTEAMFSLSEGDDDSELGVEMRWLTPAQIIEESTSCYPGLAAIKLGYLPIGSCFQGSGDPYFLKMDKSRDPPVVRIPHEASKANEDLIDEGRVEAVSSSLAGFLQRATVE
jgi:hypothetical protein